MARKCLIEREKKRAKLVKKLAKKRAELKRAGDFTALAAMPRDSAQTRQRNRCGVSGRPRAYMRKFHLCRNMFRDLALSGELPGVTKSSW